MLHSEIEERLLSAKRATAGATTENIIEECKQYLAVLVEYRAELHKMPGTLGVNRWSGPFLLEDVGSIRKAVRAAIENNTRERNRAEALLRSFTSVSGYEAVETFNKQKYHGRDDWELRAGGIASLSGGATVEKMTVWEAVGIASLLRRQEYIAGRADPDLPSMTGPPRVVFT